MSPAAFVPLILLALGVGVFLLVRWLAADGARLEAEHKARLERATRVRATVLAIENSAPQRKRGTVLMRVRLRVQGAEARETVGAWEVELAHIPAVQPEKVLAVLIDADDATRCYPAFAGARHSALGAVMWPKAGDR
jgi:hypothetical protein